MIYCRIETRRVEISSDVYRYNAVFGASRNVWAYFMVCAWILWLELLKMRLLAFKIDITCVEIKRKARPVSAPGVVAVCGYGYSGSFSFMARGRR